MSERYRVTYRDLPCSRCDTKVNFCFREVCKFVEGRDDPVSTAFDRLIHYGNCEIARSALYGHPSLDEVSECPAYQHLMQSME